MTVDELIERLVEIREHGSGQSQVKIFDPDTNAWQPVTGFTYGGETAEVKLYCDTDEEQEGV